MDSRCIRIQSVAWCSKHIEYVCNDCFKINKSSVKGIFYVLHSVQQLCLLVNVGEYDGREKLNSLQINSVIAVKNKVDVIVAGRDASRSIKV